MSAFHEQMPGAWELAHTTEMAFGQLHESSPGGGGHGTCSEDGDQVALLSGQALPEAFPWPGGRSFQVHPADAFSVQSSAGCLSQSPGSGGDPQSMQRLWLVRPKEAASPKSSSDILVGFIAASSEANASVRLVFHEFQAQLFEEILEVVLQKTAPLNVPVRDSFHSSKDGRVSRMQLNMLSPETTFAPPAAVGSDECLHRALDSFSRR